MSCILLGDDFYSAILETLQRRDADFWLCLPLCLRDRYGHEEKGISVFVNELRAWNWKAYMSRYAHHEDAPKQIEPWDLLEHKGLFNISRVQLIKMLRCAAYQCCEGIGYEESVCADVSRAIQGFAAVEEVLELEEYAKAPWADLYRE